MTPPRHPHESVTEQAAAWFVRLDAGSLSPAEHAAFTAWRANPANATALAQLERLWGEFSQVSQSPIAAHRPSHCWWPRLAGLAVAASVAAVMILGLDIPMRLRSDLRAGVGEMASHTLPDGSVALLDSDSAIALDFSGSHRTVRLLRGEALFTVAPDPSRPFLVETENGTARALGTRFAVRREPDSVAVTVLESHVQVRCCGDDGEMVTLSPGQQVRYSANGLESARTIDSESQTAWTRGKLIFTDWPLDKVVTELNRHFSGHILVRGELLRQRMVSGVFSATDPLAAVTGLQQALNLRRSDFGPWLVILAE